MSPTVYGVKQMGTKEPTKFVCIFCDFQTNLKKFATYPTAAVVSRKIMYYLPGVFNYKSRISKLTHHEFFKTGHSEIKCDSIHSKT
jgi:hypothetical protein